MTKGTPGSRLPVVVVVAFVFLSWTLSGTLAQTPGMEYEQGEGRHQEEWYDPSDWFDSDAGIDYETDWWNATYGYDYYDPYDREGIFGYYDSGAAEEYDGRYGDEDYQYDYHTDTWSDPGPNEAWYE